MAPNLMNETNQSLEEILFDLAVQKPTPEERAGFLDHACRDNPSLRAALDELLESHFGAAGFLPHPAPHVQTGRHDEAIKLAEELLPLSRKVNGSQHPDTLRAMGQLANSYDQTGRQDEARKLRAEMGAMAGARS